MDIKNIKLGKTVELRLNNDGDLSSSNEFCPTKYEGIILVHDDKVRMCLVSSKVKNDYMQYLLDAAEIAEISNDKDNKSISNFRDHEGEYFLWISYDYLWEVKVKTEVKSPVAKTGFDGCQCSKCKSFELYAEPNSSGVFVCWSCQQSPYRSSYR